MSGSAGIAAYNDCRKTNDNLWQGLWQGTWMQGDRCLQIPPIKVRDALFGWFENLLPRCVTNLMERRRSDSSRFFLAYQATPYERLREKSLRLLIFARPKGYSCSWNVFGLTIWDKAAAFDIFSSSPRPLRLGTISRNGPLDIFC